MRCAYELLFSRLPTNEEQAANRQFLDNARIKLRETGTPPGKVDGEAWRSFARVLLRLNEFVYLD